MKNLKGPDNTMFSQLIHLAKLNPKCHMNFLDYLQQKSPSPRLETIRAFF